MSSNRRPRLNYYDGHPLSLLVPEDVYRYATSYQANPGDTFLVSYPKCGNTWLMQIVYLLTHDAQPVTKDKKLYMEIPFLEFEGENQVSKFQAPRTLKSHLPADRLQFSKEAKYIYITRNPKDCCVSLYHHTKGFIEDYDFDNGLFDDFFEAFMDGGVDSGEYFNHLLSWWKFREEPNVLFLTYEKLKANPAEGIAKIGEFLGGDAAELVRNPEKLQRVIELSSFSNMKKDASKYQYTMEGSNSFFRKAAVGDWRNHFSEEQAERIDERFAKRTTGTDIPLLWTGISV